MCDVMTATTIIYTVNLDFSPSGRDGALMVTQYTETRATAAAKLLTHLRFKKKNVLGYF